MTESARNAEATLGKRTAEEAGVRGRSEEEPHAKRPSTVQVISKAPVRRLTQKTTSIEEVGPSPQVYVSPLDLVSASLNGGTGPRMVQVETPIVVQATGGAPLPEGYLEAIRARKLQAGSSPSPSRISSPSTSGALRSGPQVHPSRSIVPSSSSSSSATSSSSPSAAPAAPSRYVMSKGGETWEDPTLAVWGPEDYRLFCGDLGNDVDEETLRHVFSKYPSFKKARVVKEKKTGKSKGYGFISFSDPKDYIRAVKEMNGKYVGSRPIKLRQSKWKDRLKECL